MVDVVCCFTMQEVAADLSQTMLNRVQPPKDCHRPGKFASAWLCIK